MLQTTFARLAMLLAQLARMELPPNVLSATRDIFYSLRQQLALILVQMGIGKILQANLAVPAILIVPFVRVTSLVNVLSVNQGTFCSQLLQQPHVLIPVQVDIGRTLSTIFARSATLLALVAQAQAILNAPLVVQDIFCSHRQQHALILVSQLDIGRTLQTTFAHLAMSLAQFVWMEPTLNVLNANQGIACNH